MNYFYIFGSGFIVSLGTLLVLGVKGNRYLGGSLICGALFAKQLGENVFLGAVLGVLGWLAFLSVTRLTLRAVDVWRAAIREGGDNTATRN